MAEKSDLGEEQIEATQTSTPSQTSDVNNEKGVIEKAYIPNEARDEDVVTLKTWMVIVVS